MSDLVSIVICSRDDTRFKRVEAEYNRLFGSDPHEIVRISDALSLCEGYNRGVALSRGSLLLFSHDDLEVLSADVARKLRFYLGRWDVVGVAGTRRLVSAQWASAGPPHIFGQVTHPAPGAAKGWVVSVFGAPRPWIDDIQALDGLFIGARREVLDRVAFDQERFDGWDLYDLDFTYSAFRAGFRLVVANDITVIHASQGEFGESYRRHAEAFMAKHGARLHPGPPRRFVVAQVLAATRDEVLELTSPGYWRDPAISS